MGGSLAGRSVGIPKTTDGRPDGPGSAMRSADEVRGLPHEPVTVMRCLPRHCAHARALFLLLVACLFGAADLQGEELQGEEQARLIPRTAFWGPQQAGSAILSPDGSMVAVVLRGGMTTRIRVVAWDRPSAELLTIPIRVGEPVAVDWLHDSSTLLIETILRPSLRLQLECVRIATGERRRLAPLGARSVSVIGLSGRRPKELLLELWDVPGRTGRVVGTTTSEGADFRPIQRSDAHEVVYDGLFRPRVRIYWDRPDPYSRNYRAPDATGRWRTILHVPSEDYLSTNVIGLDGAEKSLWLQTTVGYEYKRLLSVDLATGERRVLAAQPGFDLRLDGQSPVTGRPDLVRHTGMRARLRSLDPALDPDLAFLQKALPGALLSVSRSDADDRWAVLAGGDVQPRSAFLYDRKTRTLRELWSAFEQPDRTGLVPIRTVLVTARDGVGLPCLLARPGVAARGARRRRTPAVILLHGGPFDHVAWGWDERIQFLANRGYTVLAINFRGSSGFGKKFVNATRNDWGGRMQQDVYDAVAWLIGNGLADPRRIGIMGDSYGGYAALLGVAQRPRLFSCAVALAPVTDLVPLSQAKNTPRQVRFVVGDLQDERLRRKLDRRSPLLLADRIRSPVLLIHGARDGVVPMEQSLWMLRALKRRNAPVSLVSLGRQGHSLYWGEEFVYAAAIIESFLAKHLGGRCEPLRQVPPPGLIRFVQGRDQIPAVEAIPQGRKSHPLK